MFIFVSPFLFVNFYTESNKLVFICKLCLVCIFLTRAMLSCMVTAMSFFMTLHLSHSRTCTYFVDYSRFGRVSCLPFRNKTIVSPCYYER